MRFRSETPEMRASRQSKWHRKFCLLPRQTCEGEWVWLEYVWACRSGFSSLHSGGVWRYAKDNPCLF